MPRTADHADRHRRIAVAVFAVIAAGGIEGVSLRSVAAEAGMSLGQLQHYVPSRAELVRRACVAMIEWSQELHQDQTAAAGPAATLRRVLVHPFAEHERSRAGVRVWLAFLSAAVGDPELAAIVNQAKAGAQAEVARLLDLLAGDPVHAGALLALSDGLAQRVLTGGLDPAGARAEVDRVLALLLPS